MATHFFGLKDRTFYHSHSVGRNEFAGTGFRNPVDMAIAPDGSVYIVNRSYENRPDGVHMTVCTLDEEYITEFGAFGEADGEMTWPTSVALDSKGDVYVADVHDDHLAGLGAVDVYAATRRIAASQLLRQCLPVRVIVEPWSPVHLGLDLELLTRVHVQRRRVVGAGLEVQHVPGRALHRLSLRRL